MGFNTGGFCNKGKRTRRSNAKGLVESSIISVLEVNHFRDYKSSRIQSGIPPQVIKTGAEDIKIMM